MASLTSKLLPYFRYRGVATTVATPLFFVMQRWQDEKQGPKPASCGTNLLGHRFFYNCLHNSVTVKIGGSSNNTDKKEVIDLTEKTGYMPGVVAGLLVGAAIFLSIAFLTAKW